MMFTSNEAGCDGWDGGRGSSIAKLVVLATVGKEAEGGSLGEAKESLFFEKVGFSDDDKRVERGPKVEREELLDGSGGNGDDAGVFGEDPAALVGFDLEELLERSVDGHEAGRVVDHLALGQVLVRDLLDLDVEETQSVEPPLCVRLDLLVERVRPPPLVEEHNRDREPKVVQLEPTRARRIHDRRVVDHLDLNTCLLRTHHKVRVRRRTKRVPHNQKPNVLLPRRLNQRVVRTRLAH